MNRPEFSANDSAEGWAVLSLGVWSGMPVSRRTIEIHCLKCRSLLYRYRKGGAGALVKCFVERIAEDRTLGDLRCPTCGQEFARLRMIQGKLAHKIIQGKVFTRGMRKK